MAIKIGNSGVVKIGANIVLSVTGWSYDERDVSPVEEQAMGDTTITHLTSGVVDGSGTVDCSFDVADTTGQMAMTAGATVALELHGSGVVAGTEKLTGSVLVTQVAKSGALNTVQPVSFTYVGALTAGTNV